MAVTRSGRGRSAPSGLWRSMRRDMSPPARRPAESPTSGPAGSATRRSWAREPTPTMTKPPPRAPAWVRRSARDRWRGPPALVFATASPRGAPPGRRSGSCASGRTETEGSSSPVRTAASAGPTTPRAWPARWPAARCPRLSRRFDRASLDLANELLDPPAHLAGIARLRATAMTGKDEAEAEVEEAFQAADLFLPRVPADGSRHPQRAIIFGPQVIAGEEIRFVDQERGTSAGVPGH